MTARRTVEDVRAALRGEGIEVLELPADTSTAPLAAAALGTSVPSIVKSLLFIAGDTPVLVLAPGDRRVETSRLASYIGVETVRLAKPEEVLDVSGYPVGGVPPLAHAAPLRVLLDSRLLEQDMVYAAAGARNAIFPVSPRRLVTIAGAEMVEVTA